MLFVLTPNTRQRSLEFFAWATPSEMLLLVVPTPPAAAEVMLLLLLERPTAGDRGTPARLASAGARGTDSDVLEARDVASDSLLEASDPDRSRDQLREESRVKLGVPEGLSGAGGKGEATADGKERGVVGFKVSVWTREGAEGGGLSLAGLKRPLPAPGKRASLEW